jgi:Ca2+-binding EF-hand superfamily protein
MSFQHPHAGRLCTDQDGDGVLHYAEFVSGLLWINNKVTDAEAARFAFALLDTNKDGRVDRKEVEEAVANHTIETLTQEQVTALFEQMDPDGKGWVEEGDAVRFVAENP